LVLRRHPRPWPPPGTRRAGLSGRGGLSGAARSAAGARWRFTESKPRFITRHKPSGRRRPAPAPRSPSAGQVSGVISAGCSAGLRRPL
jgi:hypothetical protein